MVTAGQRRWSTRPHEQDELGNLRLPNTEENEIVAFLRTQRMALSQRKVRLQPREQKIAQTVPDYAKGRTNFQVRSLAESLPAKNDDAAWHSIAKENAHINTGGPFS